MADAFAITGIVSNTVYEDGVLSGSGLLKVEGQTGGFVAFQQSSAYGTFSQQTDGNWSYALNNDSASVQGLGGSVSIHDQFFVSWYGGTDQAHIFVDVTVQGRNDAAIVGGNTTATLAASSQQGTTGALSISDVDTGEKTFVARTSVAGELGNFSIDTNGAWTYSLRSSVVIPAGSTDDVFNIQTADGTTPSVKVTVTSASTSPSAGNDRLTGGAGNETIDGLGGIDTVTYQGAASNYTVTRISGGFQLVALSGQDGTDTLINVERLAFADGTLGLDTSGNSGVMYRLYKAAFDRVPDTPGLGHNIRLVDGGLTLAQMAAAFVVSAEFTNTYGALSNAQFINQLYLNVLDRAPDALGLAHNLNLLDTTLTRADMLAAYSESAENQLNVIGQIQDGIFFT